MIDFAYKNMKGSQLNKTYALCRTDGQVYNDMPPIFCGQGMEIHRFSAKYYRILHCVVQ